MGPDGPGEEDRSGGGDWAGRGRDRVRGMRVISPFGLLSFRLALYVADIKRILWERFAGGALYKIGPALGGGVGGYFRLSVFSPCCVYF